MDKTKTRWIDAQISKLIDLCEERYCIWDITHMNYRHREMKSQAFQEIADELGIEKADCQDKWNTLRGQFRREQHSINHTRSGQGADEAYKCTWKFYEALSFLTPTLTPISSSDTLNDSGRHEADEEFLSQNCKRKRTAKEECERLKTELLKKAVTVL